MFQSITLLLDRDGKVFHLVTNLLVQCELKHGERLVAFFFGLEKLVQNNGVGVFIWVELPTDRCTIKVLHVIFEGHVKHTIVRVFPT